MEILAKQKRGGPLSSSRIRLHLFCILCLLTTGACVETNPDEWPAVAERIAQDNKLCNATYQAKVQFAGPFAASGFA